MGKRIPHYRFSPQAKELLTHSGWHTGRKHDLNQVEMAYENEAVPLWDVTKRFLSEYGGLSIKYPNSARATDCINLTAEEAVEGFGGERLGFFERIVNVGILNPLGFYAGDLMMILMSEKGTVYGSASRNVVHIGDTGEQAIEHIVLNMPTTTVYFKPAEMIRKMDYKKRRREK